MTQFVLLILLSRGLNAIGQSEIDGFSDEATCKQAASAIISAYQEMYPMIRGQYKCVSIIK